MRQAVSTDKAPAPGGTYSQAIIYNGVAYVAGQGPFIPGTGELQPGDFAAQAERTFQNIGAVLEACGTSFEHVLKVSVFLTDLSNFPTLNKIYPNYFKQPFPARTTVQAGLIGKMLIEVDCIAAIPQK